MERRDWGVKGVGVGFCHAHDASTGCRPVYGVRKTVASKNNCVLVACGRMACRWSGTSVSWCPSTGRGPSCLSTSLTRRRTRYASFLHLKNQIYKHCFAAIAADDALLFMSQGRLGNALEEVLGVVSPSFAKLCPVRHVWFDFHHECRKMRWGNLAKLVDLIATDLDDQGTSGSLKIVGRDGLCVTWTLIPCLCISPLRLLPPGGPRPRAQDAARGDAHQLHGLPGPHQRGAEPDRPPLAAPTARHPQPRQPLRRRRGHRARGALSLLCFGDKMRIGNNCGGAVAVASMRGFVSI